MVLGKRSLFDRNRMIGGNMAERNEWDVNRDREEEMDRERGGRRLDSARNRESRGYEANRWENEGGHPSGENAGRGNYPRYEDRSRDYNNDWRGDDRDRERREWMGGSRNTERGESGRQGDRGDFGRHNEGGNRDDFSRGGRPRENFGAGGDWGDQGNWGTYGNRSNYDERGRYSGQWGGGSMGNTRTWREDENMQHNQLGGMSSGHSSGMWTTGAGGGYSGSYGGGPGSYTGGLGQGTSGQQGRHAGRGPKNWRRSDDRIREDINERLTDHPHIDASEIEIQVKDGEVTLTGHVEDRRTKRMVEDVAEGVSGVKEVHNNLRTSGANQGESGSSSSQSQGGETARTAGSGTTTQSKK